MRNFNYLLNFSKFLLTFLLFYLFTFKNYGWHSNAHTLS